MKQITRWFWAVLLTAVLIVGCQTSGNSYREEFESQGEWRTGSDSDVEAKIEEDVYDFLVKADDMVIWTTANQDFADGLFELDATQVGGPIDNGYGMIFRADDENGNFYVLKISGDGYVWIGRYEDGGTVMEPLVNDWWFESTAVRQGLDVTNRLKVRVEGPNMIFYVNNEEVGRVTDETLTNGDIGLLVETLGEGGVRVHFDNFLITPLQNLPPGS